MRRGQVDLRPLTELDMTAIAQLEIDTFATPWPLSTLRQAWMGRPADGFAPAAWSEGRVVGFAIAAMGGDRAEIYRLAVSADHRRQGIARRLTECVVDAAFALGASVIDLEVRADNASALVFYRNLGFREVGRRPGYYREGTVRTDACLFSLSPGDSGGEPDAASR